MDKVKLYTVSKLAKDCNISPSKVRYYVHEDLISPIKRTENNYMIFDESSRAKLTTIKQLRNQRMTIEEIKEYFRKVLG